MSLAFSKRICFKMTTDDLVSGSLFDSRSLYFALLLTRKKGWGVEWEEGRRKVGISDAFHQPPALWSI